MCNIPEMTWVPITSTLNVNLKHIIELFHYHIIPMTLYKDVMPYFDKYKHVYG